MHRCVFLPAATLFAAAVTLAAAPPAVDVPKDPLASLRQEHPRLIGLDSDIGEIRENMRNHFLAREIYNRLRAEADEILKAPPVEHKLIGPRLLDQSRRALNRTYTLSLLFRITDDNRYRDRAVQEMLAAASFPDWNPSHFLDTAEMTHALAIGYDWLYSSLSDDERTLIRTAIIEKGLKAALPIYEEDRGWARATHNWNQVCNGGIAIGALAIAEDEPELARRVLNFAINSVPRAMRSYAPDGGWNEGPGYWHYATRYNVYFLAALETALGTDFALSQLQGFDRAGHFRVYFNGPSGKTFNYADAGDSVGTAEEMFWLARRFKQRVYAWDQHQQLEASIRAHALDLVWFTADEESPTSAVWPANALFKGVNTVFLRSNWFDPDRIFVGIKGGDNKANHSHLDLGSFVIDYGDTRFATDLGPDDYNLPAYFGGKRWTYYRLTTQSHNTVVIDGADQDPKAEAPVTQFDAQTATAAIDMTKAYPGKMKSWKRSVQLKDKRVSFRDEIVAAQPVDAVWGMVTEADVAIDGRRATLTRGERAMLAEIVSPEGAKFEVVPTQPPAPQRQNEGTRKLIVRLPGKAQEIDLRVTLAPR